MTPPRPTSHEAGSKLSPARQLLNEAFLMSTATLLGLALLEELAPGFVSTFISLNALLIITLVLGGIRVAVGWEESATSKRAVSHRRSLIVIAITAVVVTGLTWISGASFGRVGLVVALCAGVATALIVLIASEPDDGNQ